MRLIKEFLKGIWNENPIFRMVLGMCPTLAVTTSVENGIGMGMATTFVLVCSNTVISLLRNLIPSKVRIPCFIVVIATFVTVVDLIMNGFAHDLHKSLGIFIPLIVVNCIILARAEGFASKNPLLLSTVDGLGMGIGFTIGLVVLAACRELLGNGSITIWGQAQVHIPSYKPMLLMVLAPGGFIALGCLLGGMNRIQAIIARRAGKHFEPPRKCDCRHCVIANWLTDKPSHG